MLGIIAGIIILEKMLVIPIPFYIFAAVVYGIASHKEEFKKLVKKIKSKIFKK